MTPEQVEITTDAGERVTARAPVIVSASRATDIPAFYAHWFFRRLRIGYSAWTNPFDGRRHYVSYARTRMIVFWSKNPRPLLPYLDELDARGIHSCVHFTLNDYEQEGFEPGVPPLDARIETFRLLARRLGSDRVVWRFDPLLLTERIGVDELLRKIEGIGDRLHGCTEKLVFSFADLGYRRVRSNLLKTGIRSRAFDEGEMLRLAAGLSELNGRWGYALATCAERVDLARFGIAHNRCIDDEWMIRRFADDPELMHALGVETVSGDLFGEPTRIVRRRNCPDRGQRPLCGCAQSKDIGEYATCPHQCVYCYANASPQTALANYRRHLARPDAETITGK